MQNREKDRCCVWGRGRDCRPHIKKDVSQTQILRSVVSLSERHERDNLHQTHDKNGIVFFVKY